MTRLPRWGTIAVSCAAISAAVLAGNPLPAKKALSFDERVAAHEAVLRVYYDHLNWPKENPGPKPPFEVLVPKAQIEERVADDLAKSTALERLWRRPVTGEELQAEVDRMARETQDPETLLELYVALKNDPRLVAECLARPIVADRLLREAYSGTEGEVNGQSFAKIPFSDWLKEVKRSLPRIPSEPQASYHLPNIGGSGPEASDGCAGSWSHFPSVPAAVNGSCQGAWTGFSLFVWNCMLRAGAVFTPATNTWVSCNNGQASPTKRSGETRIWTGSEAIIWGGFDDSPSLGVTNTGARYSPFTDHWTPTSLEGSCPTPRDLHTAVWTGSEMIVWGGRLAGGPLSRTGGRYDPGADAWSGVSIGANCPEPRGFHSAVWTGSEMIVWGGVDSTTLSSGARYRPADDTWQPINASFPYPGREQHLALWTGKEMIIWGGQDGTNDVITGARYDPASDAWKMMNSGLGCPSPRFNMGYTWTGTQMIVWGGSWVYGAPSTFLGDGARYFPDTDTWVPMGTSGGAPSARQLAATVWTGSSLAVVAGQTYSSQFGDAAFYTMSNSNVGTPQNPPAITAYDISACATGISVNWTADPAEWGDTGETAFRSYQVLRDGAPLASGGCKGILSYGHTSCTDSTTASGGHYVYQVAYKNACDLAATTAPASVEDHLGPPTAQVSAPSPLTGATQVSQRPVLAWAPVEWATSYDVYFGTADPPPMVGTTPDPTFTPTGPLAGSTLYHWQVTSRNECGAGPAGPGWTLTTLIAPQVTSVKKLSSPFRLKLTGANFAPGAVVRVNGVPVPQTTVNSSGQIMAKGGSSLKGMLPRGVPACILVVNPDTGESACFTFTP